MDNIKYLITEERILTTENAENHRGKFTHHGEHREPQRKECFICKLCSLKILSVPLSALSGKRILTTENTEKHRGKNTHHREHREHRGKNTHHGERREPQRKKNTHHGERGEANLCNLIRQNEGEGYLGRFLL